MKTVKIWRLHSVDTLSILHTIFYVNIFSCPQLLKRVRSWKVTSGLCQHTEEAPAVRCFLSEPIFSYKIGAVYAEPSQVPTAW